MTIEKHCSLDEEMMTRALAQARLAYQNNEVPIGAVVLTDEGQVFEAYNRIETEKCATAHAEILAIEAASKEMQKWRLENCQLYVTLDPCPMCMGAIRLARIRRVVIAATDSRMGCVSKFQSIIDDKELGPCPEIATGVLREQSQKLLKDFFSKKRG